MIKRHQIFISAIIICLSLFFFASCNNGSINDVDTITKTEPQSEIESNNLFLISQIEETFFNKNSENNDESQRYITNLSYNNNTILIEHGADPITVNYSKEEKSATVLAGDRLISKFGYDDNGKIVSWETRDLTAIVNYPNENTILLNQKLGETVDYNVVIILEKDKMTFKAEDTDEIIKEYKICDNGIVEYEKEIVGAHNKTNITYTNNGKIKSINTEYDDSIKKTTFKYKNDIISHPYQLIPSAIFVGTTEEDILAQLLLYQVRTK